MSTSTQRKKRDRTTGNNASNSTVATATPTTNNTTLTFTQRIVKVEKISTPTSTQRKKRAKTSGINDINSTVATATPITNNATVQLQNLTTQMNAMKNEFDVKLSQLTNIQRDQQYQLKILCSENKKLKTEYEAKINEMKNEFKKQLDDLKKKDSSDSRSGSSVVAYKNDELYNIEHSTVTQEVQSRLPATINNVKNIKKTKELSLHKYSINDILIFTSKSNEKMVATASADGSIKITRLNDNKLVSTIKNAHSSYGVKSLTLTKMNNNDVIASGGGDCKVKFWTIDNIEKVTSFECSCFVWSLAEYELNGKNMLACGLSHGSIELWDVQSIKKVDTLKSHDRGLVILHTFNYQNKTHLLSGDVSGKLNLWCLDENKLVKTLCSGKGGVRSLVTFDLDNDLLIAAGVGKRLMLWKMSNLELYHKLIRQDDSYIRGLKPFMSDGNAMLATVSEGGWFRVFNVKEKKVVHEFKCEDHKFISLDVFEEGGNCVFIAGGEDIDKDGSIVFLE